MNKFDRRWENIKYHYFDYNGERYYAGAKFKIRCEYSYDIRDAYFVSWCDHDPNLCLVRTVYPWPGRTADIWVPLNEMSERIIEMYEENHYVETSGKIRYFRDIDIPELFFGWIIYLMSMGILFIFNDRWLGWIVGSIYFFCWRKKIKEENIYVEEDNR